jgi:hypothetical protein
MIDLTRHQIASLSLAMTFKHLIRGSLMDGLKLFRARSRSAIFMAVAAASTRRDFFFWPL